MSVRYLVQASATLLLALPGQRKQLDGRGMRLESGPVAGAGCSSLVECRCPARKGVQPLLRSRSGCVREQGQSGVG